MSADHYNAAPVPPEQGAANAEELAYRLRQQQLTADFGLLALKNHDAALLLQEATPSSRLKGSLLRHPPAV